MNDRHRIVVKASIYHLRHATITVRFSASFHFIFVVFSFFVCLFGFFSLFCVSNFRTRCAETANYTKRQTFFFSQRVGITIFFFSFVFLYFTRLPYNVIVGFLRLYSFLSSCKTQSSKSSWNTKNTETQHKYTIFSVGLTNSGSASYFLPFHSFFL